ncbi:MAG TPA: A24 family peptidase [Gaiellaceae bacterium]|jgi:leader peptidase (prepilin peptidase)/N-methyltransferase
MSVETEPETDTHAVEAAPRRPTRELLPTAWRMYAVVGLSAALLIASFADFGFTGRGFVGAVLCPVLVLLAAIDFEHRLLPNDIIAPASLAIGLIIAIASPGAFLLPHLAAGAALGFFFLAFALIFRGSLGIGDAKLGFLLGLALGSRTFAGVLIAFAGLLIAALTVLARNGLSARKQALAFGPYLAIGGIVAFFFA